MYINLDFEEYKKMNVSLNAYSIYKLMQFLEKKKIRPYRQLLAEITGFSPRSITNYFGELKKIKCIEQKTLYSPQSTIKRKDDSELLNLFNKVMEEIQ